MLTFIVILCSAVVLLGAMLYLHVLFNCFRKAKVELSMGRSIHGRQKVIKSFAQAPGPFPLPLIGNLHQLRHHTVPFQAFTYLSKTYGNIYTLTLGTTRCLVVNNLEIIREVLNQNGKFFGGRPDFLRYHKLFGGDRNNSLALCDWSNLQQKRRNLARRHCSPRDSSSYFSKLSEVGCFETNEMMEMIKKKVKYGQPFHIKPLIQQTCANMFIQYMCSIRFEHDDVEFQKAVEYFDEIFWEINQGYAVDFLTWLSPLYKKHFDKIMHWSTTIRKFILNRIVDEREQKLDMEEPEQDFTDALLKNLADNKNVSRDTIIFMLEDFIGGHSAVGNLVMMALTYAAKNPQIIYKIREETDMHSQNGARKITLYDMDSMPYTMATIFEVLRFSSSPIVPHVATEDAVISGYGVTSGTIVFINNYNLNRSDQYWKNPDYFEPQRFLEEVIVMHKKINHKISAVNRRSSEGSDSGIEFEREVSNLQQFKPLMSVNGFSKMSTLQEKKLQLKKNMPHFLPFSIGKRTCIGQNLVRGFGFLLLSNILQKYDVRIHDSTAIQISPACIALPTKTFPLILTERLHI